MSEKMKNLVTVILSGGILFAFFLWCLIKPATATSESERRPLAAFPKLSVETILDGTFMSKFETYTQDQFPMRDTFRTLKSISTFYVFRQKDNHSIYLQNGYASKIEYPMKQDSLDNVAKRFQFIYDTYLKNTDTKLYLSVIPDKNYFLAEKYHYPSLDYDAFISYLREKTDYLNYIDITDLLELTDYYKTDTHWRQEKIQDVADRLATSMGTTLNSNYTQKLLDQPFYGVYYGQSSLPLAAEDLYYLESDTLSSCKVFNFETNKYMSVYDMEKGHGKDPYETFLSGSISLLKIENPNATTDKELIIFRDSFGSSLAPLLVDGYASVTLVDIRYIPSQMLKSLIKFNNQDVLFMYSTIVLNNSETFK